MRMIGKKRLAIDVFISFFLIFFFICCGHQMVYSADYLMGFEEGSLTTSSGGLFFKYENDRTHGPDYQYIGVEYGDGAEGTGSYLKDIVTKGNIYIYYYGTDSPVIKTIPQAKGADRLSFYIKLPEGYPLGNDYNFHVGTYTKDPINGDPYQAGSHYYHYFNIPGTGMWTKIVCNQHPTHRTGVSGDPGNNPTAPSWDYFDGLTRFYLDMQPESPIALPWTGYIDEFKFYSISEPENDETVNSISCSYFGMGHFQIGWHSDGLPYNNHKFEVRYSTSPITNANYSSATVCPNSPYTLAPNAYHWIKAEFTISVKESTRYYFAIKDIDSDLPYVSKIDYLIGINTVDEIPPEPPAGIGANLIK